MALKWTFSGDRCFRRCERQYYFREIAAHHSARDPLRREAFILKQVKGLELWRGLLVHTIIQTEVVPSLQAGSEIAWESAITAGRSLALQQFQFSRARRFREAGMTKTKAGLAYQALDAHERGEEISDAQVETVLDEVATSIRALSTMEQLWQRVSGCKKYWVEQAVSVEFGRARIEARIDLLCFKGYGKPIIVEWKTYAGDPGSDARLQTALYGWLLCRHPTWRVNNPRDIELLEVQLPSGMLIEHRCDEADFEALEDRIFRGVEQLGPLVGSRKYEEQTLSDFAFARSPMTCAYCPFRTLCLGDGLKNDLGPSREIYEVQRVG